MAAACTKHDNKREYWQSNNVRTKLQVYCNTPVDFKESPTNLCCNFCSTIIRGVLWYKWTVSTPIAWNVIRLVQKHIFTVLKDHFCRVMVLAVPDTSWGETGKCGNQAQVSTPRCVWLFCWSWIWVFSHANFFWLSWLVKAIYDVTCCSTHKQCKLFYLPSTVKFLM